MSVLTLVLLIPIFLTFCCLCTWSVVAMFRRPGAKSPIWLFVIGLPVLVVSLMGVILAFSVHPQPETITYHETTTPGHRAYVVEPEIVSNDARSSNHNNEFGDLAAVSPATRSHQERTMAPVNAVPLNLVILVAVMLGVAVMIGLSVFLAGQGGSLRLRDVGAKFVSLIWIVPALVLVAFPLWKSGEILTQTSPRTQAASPVTQNNIVLFDSEEETAAVEVAYNNEAPGEATAQAAPGMPAWVHESPRRVGDAQFFVVKGGFSAAVDDSETQQAISLSESQATAAAVAHVRNYISQVYPLTFEAPQLESIARQAYQKTYLESRDKEFGRVYRQHVQIKLSPDLRDRYYPHWKEAAAHHRLIALGVVVGMITLLLGTMTAYLRLDQMTAGAYRGRLKLASLSLITAGAIVTLLA